MNSTEIDKLIEQSQDLIVKMQSIPRIIERLQNARKKCYKADPRRDQIDAII